MKPVIQWPTAQIYQAVIAATGPLTPDGERFWRDLITGAPVSTSMAPYLRRWGLPTSSVISRFERAGLPAPRQLLNHVRLVDVAWLYDQHDLTSDEVAAVMRWASAMTFRRALRRAMGMLPREYAATVPFNVALERFVGSQVAPYAEAWRTFTPFTPSKGAQREPVEVPECPFCHEAKAA